MRAHSGHSGHSGKWTRAGAARALCGAALAALILPAAGCGAGTESLAAEAARLAATLAGRWDNQEQHYFERRNGAPEQALHERIHSIFAPVSLSGLSGNVLYVEQFLDGDPAKIYRQRIYHIYADDSAGAVRLDILALPDPAAARGAHENPALLAGLNAESLRAYPGCEVFWKPRAAGGWTGKVPEGACSFVSQRSGKRIVVEDDLLLTRDELWIYDRAHDESGALVYGNRAGIPHKLRRARSFECWAGVHRLGEAAPIAEDSNPENWRFARGLQVQSQGGRVRLPGPAHWELKLREVHWPEEMQRSDALTLYVLKDGAEPAAAYAWTLGGATRIGINLRHLQASCTQKDAAATGY